MAVKKYVNLSNLSTFLESLRNTFAELSHTHKLSDITDYTVDSELSSSSTNPVQNKVLDAEFEVISQSFSALESAIDNKSDANHSHDDIYYTESEIDSKFASANSAANSTYETKNDASSKLTEAKSYADSAAATVKNDLLNGAGAAYDTLKELGDLINDNTDAIDALETVAAGKADKSHAHDERYYTMEQIDDMEFVTIADIDAVCVINT